MAFRLKNSKTSEIIELPDDADSRSLYQFKLVCKGLERLAKLLGWQVYFLTLTLSDDHLDTVNADLNGFISWLRVRFRRAGGKFFYTWVVELQKKRYAKYGKLALHWHFAILAPPGSLPDVAYIKSAKWHYRVKEDGAIVGWRELVDRWGRGQVFCMQAYSNGIYKYLGKYFTKEYHKLDGYNPAWANLRRFGSSQLKFFRYPNWAYDFVTELLRENPDWAEQFYIRKARGVVGFWVRDGKKFLPALVCRSPWHVCGAWENSSGVSVGIESSPPLPS